MALEKQARWHTPVDGFEAFGSLGCQAWQHTPPRPHTLFWRTANSWHLFYEPRIISRIFYCPHQNDCNLNPDRLRNVIVSVNFAQFIPSGIRDVIAIRGFGTGSVTARRINSARD